MVRPGTEFRIQLTGVGNSLVFSPGVDTLLLGWSQEFQVFVGFEATRHSSFGYSPSIQVNEAALVRAQQAGLGFHTRGNLEVAVCFAPDQFQNYVFNLSRLHGIARQLETVEELDGLTQQEPPGAEQEEEPPQPRQEIVEEVRRWVRQRDFRRRVLTAYEYRCSVCNVQLELVEAAHIVPVRIPGSTDLTNNGVSLCSSHHLAYDNGLLGIAPNYHVIVNQAKLNNLRFRNLNIGEETLLGLVCSTIRVPNRRDERPVPANLSLGLRVRGWPEESY